MGEGHCIPSNLHHSFCNEGGGGRCDGCCTVQKLLNVVLILQELYKAGEGKLGTDESRQASTL